MTNATASTAPDFLVACIRSFIKAGGRSNTRNSCTQAAATADAPESLSTCSTSYASVSTAREQQGQKVYDEQCISGSLYRNLALQFLPDYVHEGMIDTLKFRSPGRARKADLVNLTEENGWKRTRQRHDEKTGRVVYQRFRHKGMGAKVTATKSRIFVEFSPIRVLGRPSNLRIDLVTHSDLMKSIAMMTTGLFPDSPVRLSRSWFLIKIALTRNMKLGNQRDFVYSWLGLLHGTSHTKGHRFAWPIKKRDGSIKEREPCFYLYWGRPYKKKKGQKNSNRGASKRDVFYDKGFEQYGKQVDDPNECAAGISRFECTFAQNATMSRFERHLPAGSDFFIRIKKRKVGLKFDYKILHAILLHEMARLYLKKKTRSRKLALSIPRRNALHAQAVVIRAAYPGIENLAKKPCRSQSRPSH